jgi:hypothetical protein
LQFLVEPLELLALRVQQVLRELLAQQALPERKVLRELQARKGQPELMALMVLTALLVLKDRQVLLVQLVQLALRAFKGRKVIQAHRAPQVQLERQVVLAEQHLNICSTPPPPMQTLERESWR